jgi:phosphoribosylformylglycinamidine (FGAM) synthase PurS component
MTFAEDLREISRKASYKIDTEQYEELKIKLTDSANEGHKEMCTNLLSETIIDWLELDGFKIRFHKDDIIISWDE